MIVRWLASGRSKGRGRALATGGAPRRPTWLLAVVLSVSFVVLVACGGGGQPTTSPPEATLTAAAGIKQISATQAAGSTAIAPVTDKAQTQIAPTTAAGATQAVSTIQAGGTVVAGTVAAGTPVATIPISPQLQALATQAAGAGGAALATQIAGSPVQIIDARIDQPDTWVIIKNNGSTMGNIGGWTMLFTAFGVTIPLNTLVLPGGTVKVHFAPGVNTPTDVFLGTGQQIMADSLKPGNRIVLITREGQVSSVHQVV